MEAVRVLREKIELSKKGVEDLCKQKRDCQLGLEQVKVSEHLNQYNITQDSVVTLSILNG